MFTSSLHAADYMPPPLFGEQMPITKVVPEPVAPTPPPKQIVPAPIDPPQLPPLAPPVSTTKSLPATTDVILSPKPTAQPQDRDLPPTFTVDDLLAHPADNVDARAKAALSRGQTGGTPMIMGAAPPRPAGLAKPILENDPSAPPPPAPKKVAPKIVPRPAGKPAIPLERAVVTTPPGPAPAEVAPAVDDRSEPPALMDYEMPDLSKETPVDVDNEKTSIPEDAVVVTPEDNAPQDLQVTQPKIVSPSPTVKKIVQQNPKVMVYSRDKETGEFKKVDRDNIVIKNEGHNTTFKSPDSLPPAPSASQTNPKVTPPPPPRPVVMTTQTDPLAKLVVPLTAEDISRGMLDEDVAGVTPSLPPSSVPQGTPAQNTAAAPDTVATLDISFKVEELDLTDEIRTRIDQAVLSPLMKTPDRRVEILAFASPRGDEAQSDRRVALARGLAVRDYLMSQKILGTRIDLKVMGNVNPSPVKDRVEFWVK